MTDRMNMRDLEKFLEVCMFVCVCFYDYISMLNY